MKYLILSICLLSLISPLLAEITPIPQGEYFTTARTLLDNAENSIEVEMYLIHSNSEEVRALLDELSLARQRGVKVSILLEDSEQENRLTAEYLKEKGVEVSFDSPDTKLHAKKVLIWSEEELENKWNQLSERHGLDLLSKARTLAVQINEPCDPDVVSSFIILIEMYGEELVNRAIDRATSLSFENGKWEMRYIIGILKKPFNFS